MGVFKRKYKNIKLEQNELSPTAIGMFENRRKSSIGTVIILGIFILAVFFLPDISEKVNEYLNPKTTTPTGPNNPSKKPSLPEAPTNNDNFYEFVDNLKVTNNDITVSNFIIDQNTSTIKYDVTNNLTNTQNLEELNYYLEIFNKEQTLIERIKLADEKTLNNGAFASFKRNISTDSATTIGFISVVKKTINDYPLIELKSTEDGNSNLVCSNTHEKVTYKFLNNGLKEVTSEASYLKTDTDYEELYESNKLKSSAYNSKLGIASTFFEYENGYNITTQVNLNETGRVYIFSADSFRLDTEPKVVKFEIEAQGFKCE